MDILEFYKNNKIDMDFDEHFYAARYPETKDFYQPYCKHNNIDDKHRLFFHYAMYGKKMFFYKNLEEKMLKIKLEQKKRGRDDIDIDSINFNF
jgi:hypothetical protein